MTIPSYPKWARIAMITSVVLILGRIILKIAQVKTPVDGFVNAIMNLAIGASLVAIVLEILDGQKKSEAEPSNETNPDKEE